MAQQRSIIGHYGARERGLQFGKCLEFEVFSVPTSKGGTFNAFEIFKPWESKKPEDIQRGTTLKRGFNFPFPNGIKELIDMVNTMIQLYAPEKGVYVFHPQAAAAPMPPQAGYAPQPQGYAPQGPQPGYAPQQQYGQQPQVQSQPQTQYSTPPSNGPRW